MASSRSLSFWPIASIIVAVLVLIVTLPPQWKTWAPGFLRSPDFHFGLDLAGGTQLDFRISEEEIHQQLTDIDAKIADLKAKGGSTEDINRLQIQKQAIESQQQNLVEAIRMVLERRINSLGVSEATITPSYLGGEKHLLVDCPGVVDIQKCIQTVGKTIQLEFKEEFPTDENSKKEYEKEVRAKVNVALARIRGSGATLQVLGQDLGTQLGMGYQDARDVFRDELPKGLEDVWNASPSGNVLVKEGSIKSQRQNDKGQVVEVDVPGIFLVEVVSPKTSTGRTIQQASTAFQYLAKTEKDLTYNLHDKEPLDTKIPAPLATALKSMKPGELKAVQLTDGSSRVAFLRQLVPGHEEVEVSHILVSYKGASEAAADVSRTKEQALARAKDLKKQLDAGANFEQLASTQSDGPSRKNSGHLGAITRGSLVPSFEQIAFTSPAGKISDPVETPFGYHLIRVDKATYTTPDTVSFDSLTVAGTDSLTRANTFIGRMQSGGVKSTEEALKIRTLFFSLEPTGWKDTQLDGKHFRTANVTLDPTTNVPVVQIIFDDEGGKLFQELTKRNLNKRIAIFVGGELVSAPMVQTEIVGGTAVITGSNSLQEAQKLAQDLNTGAIPAPIYLSGQRTVEATLGTQALLTSVKAAVFGMIILMLFMLIVYRFLGLLADLALLIYSIIFIAILKLPLFLLSSQYIVLTLAGTAGMILSIGMAVDTNVLVFERVKEELRKGKSLKTAIEVGFTRAWPSIRDSNISTIITCVLLFIIGTSIVRGFAITLGMGVLISMFTGMIIIRWIARKIATTPIANHPEFFPGIKKHGGEAHDVTHSA